MASHSPALYLQTGLLQVAVDAKAVEDAKHTVETMLASGSDSSACGDLADTIIGEVASVVKGKEEVRRSVPGCPKNETRR